MIRKKQNGRFLRQVNGHYTFCEPRKIRKTAADTRQTLGASPDAVIVYNRNVNLDTFAWPQWLRQIHCDEPSP